MRVSDARLAAVLRQFGHDEFRPGQERSIRTLLARRDVLAVLPTGAGKSLVYQVASQLLPGLTLVVSPLIALMRDQQESIEDRGIEVGVINSTVSETVVEGEIREVQRDASKLLYVTPERFEGEEFYDELFGVEISLFVVDEAHCISEWGHDFRPAYLGLASAAERLGRPPILALTATAPPLIRAEIIERLGLHDPAVVVHGVDRPNLFFEVRRVEEEAEDRRVLQELLTETTGMYGEEFGEHLGSAMQGPGIIYTRTTRGAEETASWLREWGIAADYYHGQRKAVERAAVQEAFRRGKLQVIAATNAFGLGIDKPDIRFVIHRDIPANVESYYQEAGRAGRDGAFARCTLIYRPADLSRAAFLSGVGKLTLDDVRAAGEALRGTTPASLHVLGETSGLSHGKLARLITLLQEQGVVREEEGEVSLTRPEFAADAVVLDEEEDRKQFEKSRVEMMRGYAELTGCRRRYILNYFGEEYPAARCGLCDNDVMEAEAGWVQAENEPEVSSPFQIGDHVVHGAWGKGVVERVTGDTITVLFDSEGYRTLDLGLVLEQGLLAKGSEAKE